MPANILDDHIGDYPIFSNAEEFELGYAGDDTIRHEKAALERAGAQDTFCMICLREKPGKLYPELNPGEIHFCPRKFCESCCEIPDNWKYKGASRLTVNGQQEYHYTPIACWICLKRGWDFTSPLLGRGSPHWAMEKKSFHELISRLRHINWELPEASQSAKDLPRIKYLKLADKFFNNSNLQLQNDRNLLEAMRLDVFRPGIQFAPLLRGGISTGQTSSSSETRSKRVGRPRKYPEQPIFDSRLAFKDACKLLEDNQDQLNNCEVITEVENTNSVCSSSTTSAAYLEHAGKPNGRDVTAGSAEDLLTSGSEMQNGESSESLEMTRLQSTYESGVSSSMYEQLIQQQQVPVAARPSSRPSPPTSVDFSDEEDPADIWVEKFIAESHKWRKRSVELKAHLKMLHQCLSEQDRKRQDQEQQQQLLLESLSQAKSQITEEKDKAKSHATSAQTEIDRLQGLVDAAEVLKSNDSQALRELSRQLHSLEKAHESLKKDKLNSEEEAAIKSSECDELRTRVLELTEELSRAKESTTQLDKDFSNAKSEHNKFLENTKAQLSRVVKETLEHCQESSDVLEKERRTSCILDQEIARLKAKVEELLVAEATFGFELGRALNLCKVKNNELTRYLAIGYITPAMVLRLQENELFRYYHRVPIVMGSAPPPEQPHEAQYTRVSWSVTT